MPGASENATVEELRKSIDPDVNYGETDIREYAVDQIVKNMQINGRTHYVVRGYE